jgi:hypothetical protein
MKEEGASFKREGRGRSERAEPVLITQGDLETGRLKAGC